jgi:M6 family metalloprotease-like protein
MLVFVYLLNILRILILQIRLYQITTMKNIYTLFALVLFIQSTQVIAQRSNCSAYPGLINTTQPDGSALSLYIRGNEVYHYYETTEGYTVLQNENQNGQYEYAMQNTAGDIITSGVAVGQSFSKTEIPKHLKPSANQIKQAYKTFIGNTPAQFFNKTNDGNIFPSIGTRKLLVVLMQFPDEAAVYPSENMEDLMSAPGYNQFGCAGSFRDFYLQNSHGQLDLDITVLGWYTAAKPRVEYGKTTAQGSNNPNYNNNVQQLVMQTIDSAKAAGINFADYDNDGDGDMDGLVIFHSGYGAEEGKNGYIWSHRWSLFSNNVKNYDGVSIRNYCINPLKRDLGFGLTQVRIGVVSHEFGHVLGLPDLYDVDDHSEGAGNWCLMAGGGWLNDESTPCQQSAWCKTELGWLTPTTISSNGKYILPNTTDSNFVYKVNTPVDQEYFLLENRQRKHWDKYLATGGLAVWHIDLNKAENYKLFGSNDVNTDTAMYGVGLKQADGFRELERKVNRGNSGDLFPGSSKNTLFTSVSNPNSNLHTLDDFGNPLISNVTLVNIKQEADSTISFDFGGVANAFFAPSSTLGCAPFTLNVNNQSVYSHAYLWDFGNGLFSSETNPSTTYTSPGTYNVSLVVFNNLNNPIDTFTKTITVKSPPKASFTFTQKGDTVNFKNTSVGANLYQWRFEGLGSSRETNPSILTTDARVITLIAFNDECSDTTLRNVWKTGLTSIDYNPFNMEVFPNPVTERSTLSFQLANSSDVVMTIYNLLGKEVYEELHSNASTGKQEIILSGKSFPASGMYFLKLTANGQESIQRIMKQ